MASQSSQARIDRLKKLDKCVKDYVKNEKTRIENEVKVLDAILNGRTGGKGIQKVAVKAVAEVAENNLAAYLKPGG